MPENVYNHIAGGWYNFRHRSIFQKELAELAERWHAGKLLNIGCAHGPDFIPFKESFELHGIDSAQKTLELGKNYQSKYQFTAETVLAGATRLPYQDATFDYAIAIASYHHIKGRQRQLEALNELYRVLKPGGEAFITVWNRLQQRFILKRKETYVPWRSGEKTYYRYYHLFTYPELERLARKANFRILASSPEKRYRHRIKYFSRNICLQLVKD